jgi:hypothetical protein
MIKKKNELSSLSYKFRALPDHSSHEEHPKFCNRLTEEIHKTKQEHWIAYLEELDQHSVYMANHYILSPSADWGRTSIPVLKTKSADNMLNEATTNDQKSKALVETFFPPPPSTSTVPQDFAYPKPITSFKPIMEEQIERVITNTSAYKAPGPNGICNIVFKHTSELLMPYLFHLFNAVFKLKIYFDPWREFTTVILRKPGKADYSIPKAYHPIALINTTSKLLTSIVAEQVSFILENHNLLPDHHFGGCLGQTTTDSLHILETTVKNMWRNGYQRGLPKCSHWQISSQYEKMTSPARNHRIHHLYADRLKDPA